MMTETNNIALFDMDGSLADYDEAMINSLNSLAGPGEEQLTRETLHTFLKKEEVPYIKARLRIIKRSHGWWCRLKPIPMGMEVLKLASEIGFKPHVLTKGPKRAAIAWKEKVEWCQHHIDEDIDIHITSDKGMVYGKVLYDDFPDYMLRWLKSRPRGLGIMPVTPSNREFTHPNVIKWDGTNLQEIKDALVAVFNRQPGEDWKK
jgi:phosphoglycolate phosphatase-like HAD superfamily hydrolase